MFLSTSPIGIRWFQLGINIGTRFLVRKREVKLLILLHELHTQFPLLIRPSREANCSQFHPCFLTENPVGDLQVVQFAEYCCLLFFWSLPGITLSGFNKKVNWAASSKQLDANKSKCSFLLTVADRIELLLINQLRMIISVKIILVTVFVLILS